MQKKKRERERKNRRKQNHSFKSFRFFPLLLTFFRKGKKKGAPFFFLVPTTAAVAATSATTAASSAATSSNSSATSSAAASSDLAPLVRASAGTAARGARVVPPGSSSSSSSSSSTSVAEPPATAAATPAATPAATTAAATTATSTSTTFDVEPRDPFQPHLAHGLLLDRRGHCPAPQRHREPRRLRHELLRGPAQRAEVPLVEAEPGAVRLVFRGLRDAVEPRRDGGEGFVALLWGLVLGGGDGNVGELVEERALEVAQEQQALAALARPGGPPDAVDVLGLLGGQTDLDDQRHVGVVDASGRDVGREHDGSVAVAEGLGGLGALRLRLARVHLEDRRAHRGEQLGVELRQARRDEEDDDLEVRLLGGVLPAREPEGRGEVLVVLDDGKALVDGGGGLDLLVADGVDKLGAVVSL